MKYLSIAAALGMAFGALGYPRQAHADENPVTAIDVALEPDATMMRHAEAVNARLRAVHAHGFALDAEHHPHISILQRYVRTADLDRVSAAAREVLRSERPAGWALRAVRFYYIPSGDIGLAGIVVEPTAELLALQRHLVEALDPYTVSTGTAAAFVTTPADREINQPTIDYVAAFVPNQTGRHFNPHVTVGIAAQDYLRGMLSEPFEPFTFSPVGATVYQLGNFGTARRMLSSQTFTH